MPPFGQYSRTQVEAMIAQLDEPSPLIRINSLRILVDLSLDDPLWNRIGKSVYKWLSTLPEGENFEKQTLLGIPFNEIIELSAKIPESSVRTHLHLLLQSPDNQLRIATAHALARVKDPAAVPRLVSEFNLGNMNLRMEVISSLKFYDSGDVPEEFRERVREIVFPNRITRGVPIHATCGVPTYGGPTSRVRTLEMAYTEKPRIHPDDRIVTPKRNVNVGFATIESPNEFIRETMPLKSDSDYYFWVEIGELIKGASRGDKDGSLPDTLPEEVQIDVVVFSLKGSIAVTPGSDIGRVDLKGNTTLHSEQPLRNRKPDNISIDYWTKRLFFPVHTPPSPRECPMRCNIYWKQLLLQSRIVYATVEETPKEFKGGKTSIAIRWRGCCITSSEPL